MAVSLAELQAAIEALNQKVDEDIAQAAEIVSAVNALIAKIQASGNQDFTAEVQALSAIASKLTADNPAVQAAIDAAAQA